MIAEPARRALVRLAAGNRRFIDAVTVAVTPDGLREALASANPFAVVLGCSDSRVVPEIIFGETLGQLFVVRVAGNVAESVELGSIEYAVARWGCPLLVVLAHTDCGAIGAAIGLPGDPLAGSVSLGHIGSLLVPLRSNIALAPSDGVTHDADPYRGAVLANARAVAESLQRRSELLGRRVARGELFLAAALYDVETGLVEFLGLPVDESAPAVGGPPGSEGAPGSGGVPHQA